MQNSNLNNNQVDASGVYVVVCFWSSGKSLLVDSLSRFFYLAYKSTDWHGTSHFLIWICQLFSLNNNIRVCMCKGVCVYVGASLQGGVFLLLPHLLFKASYNIYLRFVSPVPQSASVFPLQSVFGAGYSGASWQLCELTSMPTGFLIGRMGSNLR